MANPYEKREHGLQLATVIVLESLIMSFLVVRKSKIDVEGDQVPL